MTDYSTPFTENSLREAFPAGEDYDAEPFVPLRSQVLRRRALITPEMDREETVGDTADMHTSVEPLIPHVAAETTAGDVDETTDNATDEPVGTLVTGPDPIGTDDDVGNADIDTDRFACETRSAGEDHLSTQDVASTPAAEFTEPMGDEFADSDGEQVHADEMLPDDADDSAAVQKQNDDYPNLTEDHDRRAVRGRARRGPYVPDVRSVRERLSVATGFTRRHGRLVAAIAAVLVVAIGVWGALALFAGTGEPNSADPAAGAHQPPPAESECPATVVADTVIGRGPGDQLSGPGVIQAFNWAYYHWRNAGAARALVSATGRVGDVADMQASIDFLPPDLRYCVSMTSTAPDTYAVKLTEIAPNGQKRHIQQVVTTDNIGGRYWITAFAKPPRPTR